MKTAFTFIELIFVIIVIGVLAAVALPRYLTVEDSTKINLAKGFIGTLNRTTGPTLWSESIAKGHKGSVNYGSDPHLFEGRTLQYYVNIPDFFDSESVNFHNCVHSGENAQPFMTKKGTGKYNIFCLDGNSSESPKFVLDEHETHQF